MVKFLRLLLLLFPLLYIPSYGQPVVPKDDVVLRRQLSESRADTARVNLLIKISRFSKAASAEHPALLDTALATATRAIKLANQLSYTEGLGLSYQALAQAYTTKKNFKMANALIKKAIGIFLSHNFYQDAAEAYLNEEEFYLAAGGTDYNVMIGYYNQAKPLFLKAGAKRRAGDTASLLGDFYLQVNQNNEAIAELQSALNLYHSVGKKDLHSVYDLLGNNYLTINNFKEALKYALLAVKTAETLKDTTMMLCTIYNRTAMVYYASHQFGQATDYFKKSITVAQRYHDNSETYLSSNLAKNLIYDHKGLEALEVLKNAQRRFPKMGEEMMFEYYPAYLHAYLLLKRYSEAKRYNDLLLSMYIKYPGQTGIQANMLGPIIEYFIATKQFQQASNHITEFMEMAKKMPLRPRFILNGYKFSYQVDSALNNYAAAFKNHKQYAQLNDSVTESIKNRQMQQLQVEFETDKKQKENTILRKESQLQTGRAHQAALTRNLSLIGTALLLIASIMLFLSFRINKRNARAISEKNESLNKLVVEKEWLIKEIHHRVKNNLQIVMGLLQRQSAYIDNDDALAAIQNSENRMHSIALIHQKLYQSENLDLIFMPDYINEMVDYLKESCGLDNRIFFEKQLDEIHLDVTQAVPLGLILNEAITNSIKYAYSADAAGIIYLSLIKGTTNEIQLTIADNGPGLPEGFDKQKVDSLGINLMMGLSRQLGGSFDISNEEGCTINIRFKTEIFNRNASAEVPELS